MDRRKKLGLIAACGLTALGLTITTLAFNGGSLFSSRLKADDPYTLVLNHNNGVTTNNYSGTRAITTASGNEIDFTYSNCSSGSGHAVINAGGSIVNQDHIRSITELSATFTTSGALKFRSSYDGATWSGYTEMKSTEIYELGSNPYYIEFSTDGSHSVDLSSVRYAYTCLENPNASGTQVSTDDTWVRVDSASDLFSGDEIIIAASYSSSWFTVQNEAISEQRYYWLQAEPITISNNYQNPTVTNSHSKWTIASGATSGKWKLQSNGKWLMAERIPNTTNYNIGLTSTYEATKCDWELTFSSSKVSLFCNNVYLKIKRYGSSPNYGYEFSGYKENDTSYRYIYKRIAGESHTEYDTPIEEKGFTAVDNNKNNYNTNSVFSTSNGLVVKVQYTDNSEVTLTQGTNGYSYSIRNSSNEVIDPTVAFGTAGNYTLTVSYKKFLPVDIEFSVGEYIVMETVSVNSDVLTFNTAQTLSSSLVGHLTANVTYNNSSYNTQNVAYSDFSSYNLSLTLINPNGITHSISSPFGVAGTWTIKVTYTQDQTVFGQLEIEVNTIQVQTITISGDSTSVEEGSDLQLTLSVNPNNATNQTVTWESSNTNVATVNTNGLVHGVSAGSATITATANDGSAVYGYIEITVTEKVTGADEGTFSLHEGTLEVGSYVIFTSSYSDGSTNAMSKTQNTNNRSGESTTISNSKITRDANSSYAAFLVEEGTTSGTYSFYDPNENGYLYAASSTNNYLRTEATKSNNSSFTVTGSTQKTITAQGNNSRNKIQWNSNSSIFSCYASGQSNPYLFVKESDPVYPESITLSGTLSVSVGGTTTLTVNYSPANTNVKNVTWSSDNDQIASVTDGIVTGVSAGTTTITATATAANNTTVSASADITVSNVSVTSVSLNKGTLSLKAGETETLVATISPANATNKNVTWSSNNNAVATVDTNGKVSAVSAGDARITVTTSDGGHTSYCDVTVTSGGGAYYEDIINFAATSSELNSVNSTTWKEFDLTLASDATYHIRSMGTKNTNNALQWNGNAYLYSTTSGGEITGVSVEMNSGKTIKVYGSHSPFSSNDGGTQIGTLEGSDSLETDAGYEYIRIVGSTTGISITSLTIYCGEQEPVNPTSISINPSSIQLAASSSTTLSVNYEPVNANQNKEVTWSISGSCATIDQNGKVTANSNATVGQTATITARLTNLTNISNTCTLTIVATQSDNQTILVYMCGADLESDDYTGTDYAGYGYNGGNISGNASTDIDEMLDVSGQPSDVNIVIETGGANQWAISDINAHKSKLARWHIRNGSLVFDEEKNYASMGLSSTLQSFIKYGLQEYPADRVSLILWNHGGAMRGVCYDEKASDDSLTNDEVNTAVAGAFNEVGRSASDKLEWIGYDACLMGVQDIAEFNSEYFNYMVASEESEAGCGWDYTEWVDDAYAKKSTENILTAIVDGFISTTNKMYSDNGWGASDQTLAWYDLSYMPSYKTAWEAMAVKLKTLISNKSSFQTFIKTVKEFGTTVYSYSDLQEIAEANNCSVNYVINYYDLEQVGSSYYDYGYYAYGIFDAYDFLNKANSSYSGASSEISAAKTAFGNVVKHSRKGAGAGNAYGMCLFFSLSNDAYSCDPGNYYKKNTNTHFTSWWDIVYTYGD